MYFRYWLLDGSLTDCARAARPAWSLGASQTIADVDADAGSVPACGTADSQVGFGCTVCRPPSLRPPGAASAAVTASTATADAPAVASASRRRVIALTESPPKIVTWPRGLPGP